MTKVTLVNPQLPFNNPPKNDSYIKTGIGYISSGLKADGHSVSLVDYRLCEDFDGAVEEVFETAPDMVGITAFSSEVPEAIVLGKILKQVQPNLPIVIGGIHASIRPENFVNAGCFDYIIRGEGEITFRKIAATISTDPKPMAFNKNPVVIWGETPDLNALPFPDRELWPDYQERILYPPIYVHGAPWVEVIASRGCPWHCAFCSAHGEKDHFTHLVNGVRRPFIRGRSVDNVVRELVDLDKKYHYHGIQFLDDQFILNPKWGWDFCDAMEKAHLLGRHWWIGTRADVLLKNRDLILRMKDIGLDVVSVGFESFSDELLKFWNKGTTSEQNYEAAAFLNEHDIHIFSNVIMGAPREDGKWYKEDDLCNLKAIRRIKPSHCSWSIFTAAPACDLEKWCIEKNLSTATNTGIRGANESKIKGVNWRWVRIEMNRLLGEIRQPCRPWYHNYYDYARMKLEGW